jgi:4-amino-4-deoxy-L-arabinose transferase-like glycosyltransferase
MHTPGTSEIHATGFRRPLEKKYRHLPAVFLFLVYIVVQSYAIHQLTTTYDEESFLQYGITLLKGQSNKNIHKFESKLPVTTLNALPRALEQLINPSLKKSGPLDDIISGRYISLLASIAVGILIYIWTFQWYGYGAGICSLLFYLLCPNFLAHGILVSSDIFACLFLALTFYCFSKWRQTGKNIHFLVFSLCFSFGQLCKFSLVHMLPVVVIICGIILFSDKNRVSVFTKNNLALAVIFVLVNWMVISAGHLFYDLFFPLDKYEYHSGIFRRLTEIMGPFAHYIFMPLPSSYIRSMDMVIYLDHLGGGLPGSVNGTPYILSHYSTNGFWYYYLVSIFYKLPIPFLLILLSSVVVYLKHFNRSSFLHREIFLVIPALYYIVYMSFFYSTQVGIRHIMIIFPLFFVFAGFLFQKILSSRMPFIIALAET